MPKEAKVEKWKLTPEMKEFIKAYKKYYKIGDQLSTAYQQQLDEADVTRQMIEEVEGMKQLMLQSTPEEPTRELEGQDVKSMEINY
jgi:hypothetical protein